MHCLAFKSQTTPDSSISFKMPKLAIAAVELTSQVSICN